MDEQTFSAGLLEPLAGERFRIELSDGHIDLTLRSVTRRPPLGGGREDPFTLLFGGASHLLPQDTYRLLSASLPSGGMDVFIVPVGQDAEGFIYEAVFA